MKKRLFDLLGLLLVGDAVLTFANPKRHCLLWEIGPQPCRDALDEFAQHPAMSRVASIGQAFIGILIAESQKPDLWTARKHL